MNKRKKLKISVFLSFPILVFFLAYLSNGSGMHPTGFIQYDNVSYVAYAKQYLDADKFHIQYSNPFNDREFSPIYVQPQTILFAMLLKAGIPPGFLLIPFTIVCSILCFYVIIGICEILWPQSLNERLHLWLLAWGGGLLVLAGIVAHFYLQNGGSLFKNIFILDPEYGWWGLNFGRSLFFTCEAYYHLLFLSCIYFLLREKWIYALLFALLLSLSHPFTGLELLGIVLLWVIAESILSKKRVPYWFAIALFSLLIFHLYYYLSYLTRFEDHRSVFQQYTLEWKLRYYRMIPAYLLVGVLAVASMVLASPANFIKNRSNRLLMSWFVVAFLLANHDLFMTARQPVHFTRGYIWTSLFLLGLPALDIVLRKVKNRVGYIGLTAVLLIFFLDNLSWIGIRVFSTAQRPASGYITTEQKDIFRFLDSETSNKTLIVSNDEVIAYLSSIYTKAYPWYSHPYTTPFAERKKASQLRFLEKGSFDSAWSNREVIFVLNPKDSTAIHSLQNRAVNIKSTNNYVVYKTVASGK